MRKKLRKNKRKPQRNEERLRKSCPPGSERLATALCDIHFHICMDTFVTLTVLNFLCCLKHWDYQLNLLLGNTTYVKVTGACCIIFSVLNLLKIYWLNVIEVYPMKVMRSHDKISCDNALLWQDRKCIAFTKGNHLCLGPRLCRYLSLVSILKVNHGSKTRPWNVHYKLETRSEHTYYHSQTRI